MQRTSSSDIAAYKKKKNECLTFYVNFHLFFHNSTKQYQICLKLKALNIFFRSCKN